jgi:hypothetical protein
VGTAGGTHGLRDRVDCDACWETNGWLLEYPQLLGLLETERCGSPGRHLEDTGEGQTGRGARQRLDLFVPRQCPQDAFRENRTVPSLVDPGAVG